MKSIPGQASLFETTIAEVTQGQACRSARERSGRWIINIVLCHTFFDYLNQDKCLHQLHPR